MRYIVMHNYRSNTILHRITFSGNITRMAHFKKTTNATEQEMYMSYKQLQHVSRYIITDSDSAYTFFITCYQINLHCVVQIITRVVTYI